MSPLRLEEEVNTALNSGQTYRQVSHACCFAHTEPHAMLVLPIAAAAATPAVCFLLICKAPTRSTAEYAVVAGTP